ncbi:hypothetical protein OA90_26850 [Labrenzia sp. OB1]|nr:hypothetical protein OA90_26850 [Labrenzia sp. OB1]
MILLANVLVCGAEDNRVVAPKALRLRIYLFEVESKEPLSMEKGLGKFEQLFLPTDGIFRSCLFYHCYVYSRIFCCGVSNETANMKCLLVRLRDVILEIQF